MLKGILEFAARRKLKFKDLMSVWTNRVLSAVLQMTLVPVLMHEIGVEGYKDFVLLQIAGSIFSLFELGFGSSIQILISVNGKKWKEKCDVAAVIKRLIVFTLFLGGTMSILIGPTIINWISPVTKNVSVFTASAIVLISFLNSVFSSFSKVRLGEDDSVGAYMGNVCVQVIAWLGVIISVRILYVDKAIVIYTIYTALSCLVNLYFFHKCIASIGAAEVAIDRTMLFGALKNMAKFTSFGIAGVLVSATPYKVIQEVLNTRNIVTYNILEKVFSFVNAISLAQLMTVNGKLARAINGKNKNALQGEFWKVIVYGAAVILVCVVSLLISGEWILSLVTRNEIIELPRRYVVLQGFNLFVMLWIAFYSTVLQLGGRVGVLIIGAPIQVGLLVYIMRIMVPSIGLDGVALAFLIVNCFLPGVVLPIYLKHSLKS